MRTTHIPRRPLAAALALFGVMSATTPYDAAAHEGPPFPIVVDEPVAGYVISVWADPDIGEAQFFIIVESPSGGIPVAPPRVSMWTEPLNGRLKRKEYDAVRQSLRNQMQFEAQPHFDAQDEWRVGIQLAAPSGVTGELTTQVTSTPPGYGRWDFAIYLFPFLFLGGLWMIAMVRRIRWRRMAEDARRQPQHAPVNVRCERELLAVGSGEPA